MDQIDLFDPIPFIERLEEQPRSSRAALAITCEFDGPGDRLSYTVMVLSQPEGELLWSTEASGIPLARNADRLASLLSEAVGRILRQLDAF